MTAAREKYKILITEDAEEDLRGIERRFARQIARTVTIARIGDRKDIYG